MNLPLSSPAEAAASDLRVEAYKAVRTHELMLDEASSKFEHAVLTALIVINGGALVAFLTLLGALLGKASGRRPDLAFAAVAIVAWALGLVAAAFAVRYASSRQSSISAAQRLMRQELEDTLYSTEIATILRGAEPTQAMPMSATAWVHYVRSRLFRQRADQPGPMSSPDRPQLRAIAGENAKRQRRAWWLSVLLFVLGAGFALIAVLAG